MKYKILQILLFILFQFADGQVSSSDSVKMREDYWQNSFYAPLQGEVYGEYLWNNEFSGASLILLPDLSFKYQGYSDVGSPEEPNPGFKGVYSLQLDTLRLIYQYYIIDSSASQNWRNKLLGKQSETILRINSRKPFYVFKKVKRYLFLLSASDKATFCEAAFAPNGLPDLNYSNGRTEGNDCLVRALPSAKQNK